MVKMAGYEAGLPFDFLVRSIGKSHVNFSTTMLLPVVSSEMDEAIILRALMLNCVTRSYSILWVDLWEERYVYELWSKNDGRLDPERFTSLTKTWSWDTPVRTDYARRQLLIEIDVLTAMALGMSLKQLNSIYELQFAVLQDYESDTWYDRTGRIVFTKNKGLKGVGVSRREWENLGVVQPVQKGSEPWDGIMKNAPAGYVFARTISDDTMPGGPVERTIEYIAPFDRCDREQDYETAWEFFADRYKETK